MPKIPTLPTLYNEVLKISMSKLLQWGYIKPGKKIKSNMVWSREGVKNAEIYFYINMLDQDNMFIELNYKFKGEPRKYRIGITSIKSNLDKGMIYYFVCSKTKLRCRNLYCVSGYFLHRTAFNGCMYECQTHSKSMRAFKEQFSYIWLYEKFERQLHKGEF